MMTTTHGNQNGTKAILKPGAKGPEVFPIGIGLVGPSGRIESTVAR